MACQASRALSVERKTLPFNGRVGHTDLYRLSALIAEMLAALQGEARKERELIRFNLSSLNDIGIAGQIRFDLIAIGRRGAR